MRRLVVMAVLVVSGCVATGANGVDQVADAAAGAGPAGGKDAGGASFAGIYASSTTALRDGDVPNLELVGGTYVRNRCYHAACSLLVPETDSFDTITGATGRTYVRFHSFKLVPNATSGGNDEQVVVIDTYEIKKTSTGIKLRKTYSSRWLNLELTTPAHLCDASGGTWAASACTCPGPAKWPAAEFVAGLGGCTVAPGASEANCDDSHGVYTDDESTPIGSFCECGADRYIADDGLCTDV